MATRPQPKKFARPAAYSCTLDSAWLNTLNPDGSKAYFKLSIANGKVQFEVNTSTKKEGAEKWITLKMSPETYYRWEQSMLKNILPSQTAIKEKIESSYPRTDENHQVEKVPLPTLKYGKGDDGVVWISVTESGKDSVVFKFLQSEYVVLYDSKGERVPPHVESVETVTSYLRVWDLNIKHVLGSSTSGNNRMKQLDDSKPERATKEFDLDI